MAPWCLNRICGDQTKGPRGGGGADERPGGASFFVCMDDAVVGEEIFAIFLRMPTGQRSSASEQGVEVFY